MTIIIIKAAVHSYKNYDNEVVIQTNNNNNNNNIGYVQNN